MRAPASVHERIRRVPPFAWDAAAAAAIFILGLIDLHPVATMSAPVGLLGLGVIGVALRRTTFGFAFVLIQAVAGLGLLLHVGFLLTHGGNLVELIMVYTVAESLDVETSSAALLL